MNKRSGPASRGATGEARFSRIALILLIGVGCLQLFFAFQLDRPPVLRGIIAAAAVLAALSFFLPPSLRLQVALAGLTAVVALFGAEALLARSLLPPGTAAERAGRPYDGRTVHEVIADLRSKGVEAYPSVMPRAFYEGHPSGIEVNGRRYMGLAGLAGVTTVHCNESGTYSVYPGDEHGFNNPKGIWTLPAIDIAVIGDSFTHGACVAEPDNFVARLRSRFPATLNLGMGGSGPLIELATLKEYLPAVKPRVVLWAFAYNDPGDLAGEFEIPFLQPYKGKDFVQDLASVQDRLDERRKDILRAMAKDARRWPGWLSKIGLHRGRFPLWVQDLVTGQDSTRLSRIIRLHTIHQYIAPHLLQTQESGNTTPGPDAFRDILLDAKRAVESWGGSLYLLYVPDYGLLKYRDDASPARRYAFDAAAGAGVPVIDLYPAFTAHPDPLSLFPFPYAHYSEAGYRLAGDAVLEALGRERVLK